MRVYGVELERRAGNRWRRRKEWLNVVGVTITVGEMKMVVVKDRIAVEDRMMKPGMGMRMEIRLEMGKGKREGEGEGDEMMLEQRTMVTLPIRSPVRWIKEDEPIRLGRPRSRSWTLYDSQISLQARMNSLLRKSTRSHPRPVSLATLTPLMAGVVSAPSSSDTVMTSAGWGSASSSWAPSRWIGSFIESPPARS